MSHPTRGAVLLVCEGCLRCCMKAAPRGGDRGGSPADSSPFPPPCPTQSCLCVLESHGSRLAQHKVPRSVSPLSPLLVCFVVLAHAWTLVDLRHSSSSSLPLTAPPHHSPFPARITQYHHLMVVARGTLRWRCVLPFWSASNVTLADTEKKRFLLSHLSLSRPCAPHSLCFSLCVIHVCRLLEHTTFAYRALLDSAPISVRYYGGCRRDLRGPSALLPLRPFHSLPSLRVVCRAAILALPTFFFP